MLGCLCHIWKIISMSRSHQSIQGLFDTSGVTGTSAGLLLHFGGPSAHLGESKRPLYCYKPLIGSCVICVMTAGTPVEGDACHGCPQPHVGTIK